jgi:hypothetical protein
VKQCAGAQRIDSVFGGQDGGEEQQERDCERNERRFDDSGFRGLPLRR